ncbi:MAG: T9SS type A sorting domain-containing protein [Saprospiraceae bacterium]|nr:T9SS type A sorting domain-containing protein [Saprospiraceae bacterium]
MRRTTTLFFSLVFLLSTSIGMAQCEWFTTGTTGEIGNHSEGAAVATDDLGNAYVAGNYTNIFSIQGQDIANLYVENPGVVLCKFNSAGVLQWIKKLDSPNFTAWDIVYRGGNIYLTGNYISYVTINGQNFSGQGENGLILKFDSTGNMVWGRTINSPSSSYAYDIAFINNNNFIFTGRFRQSVIVDGNQINGASNSKNYGVYGKMDTDGNLAWMKTSGESGNLCSPNAVTVDPNGNFYLGGVYRQGLAFGNMTAPSPGSTIASLPFIARFNASGDIQWMKTGTFPSGSKTITSSVSSLMLTPTGDIILTGFLDDAVDFMGIVSWGESTANMMRIQSNGNLLGSLHVQGSQDGNIFEFAQMDASGNLWLGGSARGNLAVRVNDQLHSIGYVASGYDILIAKFTSSGFVGIERIGGAGNEAATDGALDNAGRLLVTGYFRGTFNKNGMSATSPDATTTDLLLLKICTFSVTSDISDVNNSSEQITLTPNPAADQTRIEVSPSMIGGFCTVYDIQGRVVYQVTVPAQSFVLPTHIWENGVYVIQVQSGTDIQSERLIVQH